MAEAGSVAPVFRDGGYDEDAIYDFYHALIHNNKLYFCRQDGTIGHEPQEESDEYWFLSIDGNFADAVTLNGKSESELSVANSEKLGGKAASEYALLTALAFGVSGSKLLGSVTSLDELDNFHSGNGYVKVEISGNYQKVLVITTEAQLTIQVSFSVYNNNLKFRYTYFDGSTLTWAPWRNFATTADLAGYLPLTGGKVYDPTSNKPLSVRSAGTPCYFPFYDRTDAIMGAFGFATINMPVYVPSTFDVVYDILHTGNKPKGTYTGNGSTTSRTISSGGIGDVVMIFSTKGFAIICYWGIMTTNTSISADSASFRNGVITIATDNELLNASGKEYKYQVL